MLWRVSLFLLPLIALAVVTFRLLVQEEVARVVTIHVTDKTGHLLDMISADAQSLADLQTASTSASFVDMARASNVATVNLFDANGTPVGQNGALNAPDHAHQHNGHAQPDGVGSHGDTHTDAQHVDHSLHHHGHHVDEVFLTHLKHVAGPEQSHLLSLVNGSIDPVVHLGKLEYGHDQTGAFAQVSLPAYAESGTLLGIVSFTLSTVHIYGAMAQGSGFVGIMFTVFGVVLFGIPAMAFALQRRLAESSARRVGFLSRHDTLTGLLNRSTFTDEAEELLKQGKISYVGYADADQFKLINDTYGHSVGDAFLRHLSNMLRESLSEDALIARFGGDEFTFALSKQDALIFERKVERLRRLASTKTSIDGFAVTSSISIGLTECLLNDTLEDTLLRADTALYYAKSRGRNTIALYNEKMGDAAKIRRELEALLRDACACGGFGLAFQPLVNAMSGETVGYEALLRLQDADGNAIPPSDFIPLAEEIGLIEEIGKWVLFNAMDQVSALDTVSSVSINLSAEQFESGKLVETVAAALKQSGLPAHRLELEITESVLLKHEAHVEYQIDALKDMGISIAMDDFGTGFSSLSTLWRYGFDRIKIDKSFIQALDEAPERSQQLIDSIILLGARMGMSITAEGIETQSQKELLAELGCDVLQGFYFGKPSPLDASADRRDVV